VSVIATDLYQALSRSHDPIQAEKVGEGRKLLTFSDSRQDAAFFAPYLERTYQRAVQRRLIYDAIDRLGDARPRTEDLVQSIVQRAERTLVIDPDDGLLTNQNRVRSWLLREILAVDRRQSLEGTGCAEITVAFPHVFQPSRALLDLGFSAREVEDLLRLLFDTVRISGAVTIPEGVDIRDPIFAPRNVSLAIRANGSSAGVLSWNPSRNSNRRLDLLQKVFNRKGLTEDPAEILSKIWQRLLTEPNGPWGRVLLTTQDPQEGVLWRLAWERFEFIPTSDEHRPLQCNTCGQLWWRTVADVCPSYLCRGILSPVKDIERLLDDHYARLYTRLEPIGMIVQEHTAQWRAATASRIQDDFVRADVNVLSCSTTFELGVDVGEVESVLLRNVPPSPANYIQRAGRAGRRTDAAALAVTFAQRRSWDLSFFDNPRAMVEGKISPPTLILDNAAIVRRHVHSIAFAAFERARGAHRTVKEFFSPDEGQPLPVEEFVAWLRTHPPELENALRRVVPTDSATRLGLEHWTWVNALVEPTSEEPTHGWLTRAREEVQEDLTSINQLIEDAVQAEQFDRANSLKQLRTTLQSRQLLSFLASRNILPKYGFPVDVVQLDVARPGDHLSTDIDLSRDLAIAISEYAPGAKVVAAKSLWECTGLRILPGRALPDYDWAVCNDCGAFRHHLDRVAGECSVCGGKSIAPGRRGKFVIPVFGFVGCRCKEKLGDARPPRQALTETFFGSYRDVPPPLETTPNLGGDVSVEKRFSRQGLITIVNRGPRGRGFRLCENCGFAMPAPPDAGQTRANAGHPHARYPNRTCKTPLRFVHLGHEYLTDVLEIRVALPMTSEQARSTLYALLEGTVTLDIAREDVDGTLCPYAPGQSPAFIIFDAVPGGAGYAQILGGRLKDLFQAALERMMRCECGEETSCYNCLRSYTNQIWHETLSRGAAARILQVILGKG
jgi:hypothetical protein